MTQFCNTHYYDDKIKDIYDQIIEADECNHSLKSFDEVVSAIYDLIKHGSFKDNTLKKNVHRTLSLFRTDCINNIDHNGIRVEDLLPRIWRKLPLDDPNAISYFLEQLADIITMGPCNNGRINRLVQVYKCLVN